MKKQKNNKKNTKDDSTLNLDNEIIIGIKPLPEPKKAKNKKKSTNNSKNIEEQKNKKNKNNEQNNKSNKDIDLNTQKHSKKNRKIKKNKKIKNNKNKTKEELEDIIDNSIEIELDVKQTNKNKKIKSNKKVKKNKKNRKKNSNKKVNQIDPEEQEILRQKRIWKIHIIKWTSLSALAIAGGILFMLSPFFNVKEINVTGIERLKKDEVIGFSNIDLDENTFKIQTNISEELIKQNPYVDKVFVRRKLPDKIEIQVTERKPAFMLLFGNAYVYISTQGYLLEVAKDALDIPAIEGFLTPEEEIHPGNRLCSEDLQRLDQVLQIMKSAESNGIAKYVTKINISDKQDYILELKSEKKIVHMGNNMNLSTKMLYVVSILEDNKGVEGEIFVNTDLSNKGATFRKKI